ncbi:MAG: hypothetical protein Q8R01_09115 [Ramlibacter sp.]|nr:hypothetical protein [Ramlibacter sp.]
MRRVGGRVARRRGPRVDWDHELDEEEHGADPWALLGVGARATRRRHLQLWREVAGGGGPALTLQRLLCRFRAVVAERGWAPSTQRTNLGLLLGAARARRHPVALDVGWRAVMRAADMTAAAQDVAWPELLTGSEMEEAIAAAATQQAAVALTVCWVGALRVGDAMRIRTSGVLPHPQVGPDAVAVLLQGGKTTAREPRAVYLRLGRWAAGFGAYWRRRQSTGKPTLFDPEVADDIRTALQQVRPEASLRSVRASRVMRLSLSGAPPEDIRRLTHHASEAMLRRYQRFGLADAAAMAAVYRLPQ